MDGSFGNPDGLVHDYLVTMDDPDDNLYVRITSDNPNVLVSREIIPVQASPAVSQSGALQSQNSDRAYLVRLLIKTIQEAAAEIEAKFSSRADFDDDYTVTDTHTITVTSDPSQATVQIPLDPTVAFSYAGLEMVGNFNSENTSGVGWSLVDWSDNLDSLEFVVSANQFNTLEPVPESLAYENWDFTFERETTENTRIAGKVYGEFDRYWTYLTLNYNDESGQPHTPITLTMPNSVYRSLMGLSSSDPLPDPAIYPEIQIIPGQAQWDPFFQALYNIMSNPSEARRKSIIVNRNTEYPLTTYDNPVDDTLDLLEQIAQGNTQPGLPSPTAATWQLYDYAP